VDGGCELDGYRPDEENDFKNDPTLLDSLEKIQYE
jgi:hypothetical protein